MDAKANNAMLDSANELKLAQQEVFALIDHVAAVKLSLDGAEAALQRARDRLRAAYAASGIKVETLYLRRSGNG